jgi:hypothetical protein
MATDGMTRKEQEAALLAYVDCLTERAKAWRLEMEALAAPIGEPPNPPKNAPTATPRRHLRAVGEVRAA